MDCIIEHCSRKYYGGNYCQKHYLRWYKYGDPNITKINRNHGNKCVVNGCEKSYYARGYCNKHYQRLKKHGDLNHVIKERNHDHNDECSRLLCDEPYYCKGYCMKHYVQEYRKLNTISIWRSSEEFVAMMNVRARDNNICKWYGCNSIKNTQIHHIFPRSEYPELRCVEKYMICYCKPHHKQWHQARGDKYHNLIK